MRSQTIENKRLWKRKKDKHEHLKKMKRATAAKDRPNRVFNTDLRGSLNLSSILKEPKNCGMNAIPGEKEGK